MLRFVEEFSYLTLTWPWMGKDDLLFRDRPMDCWDFMALVAKDLHGRHTNTFRFCLPKQYKNQFPSHEAFPETQFATGRPTPERERSAEIQSESKY